MNRVRYVAILVVCTGAGVTLRPAIRPARADGFVASTCPGDFVRIPSGTYLMGSPDTEGDADEHPRHNVTVTSFCMQRLEVTVDEYQACINAGSCTPAGTDAMCNINLAATRGNHPINCVDWHQATAYCSYKNARLPTEMEWEFAARGTDGRKYPWGNTAPNPRRVNACGDECVAYAHRVHNDTKTAMYSGSDGFEETAPVGSYPAGTSPFGVLDMAGNVYEWTSSPYCYYPQHTCTSPYRMYRGGAWYTDKTVSVATRNGNVETEKSVVVGIRCAK
jgi:formylglycine-generating enzyme required for sulfatase activity